MNLACGKKKDTFLDAFASLGEDEELPTNIFDDLEQFTCDLYGQTSTQNVNTARYQMYNNKYNPTLKEKPLEKIKGMDASRLPPCKNVLQLKIARSNYVCYLWKHAHQYNPAPDINPLDCGWELNAGKFSMKWYDGEQMPESVSGSIDGEENDLDENEDIYDSSGDENDDSDNDSM